MHTTYWDISGSFTSEAAYYIFSSEAWLTGKRVEMGHGESEVQVLITTYVSKEEEAEEEGEEEEEVAYLFISCKKLLEIY